jgi:hypothetical protein
MAEVSAGMTMSLDGFVADRHGSASRLGTLERVLAAALAGKPTLTGDEIRRLLVREGLTWALPGEAKGRAMQKRYTTFKTTWNLAPSIAARSGARSDAAEIGESLIPRAFAALRRAESSEIGKVISAAFAEVEEKR